MRQRAEGLRPGRHALRLAGVCLALLCLGIAPSAHATQPVIDIWYGDTQSYGDPGNHQDWINILGDVQDPDGIASLTYSLDGGAQIPLSMGPDTRRLLEQGDFTIEIDYTTLSDGLHTVAITATDVLSNVEVKNVTLDYHAGNTWPSTTTIDWSASPNLLDIGKPVDGKWSLAPGGVRTDVTGYDRTLGFGDRTWVDYEVEMPITVHFVEDPCCPFPSVGAGLGFGLRWPGHSEQFAGEQPLSYWVPQGATVWYDYIGDRFGIGGSDGLSLTDSSGLTLTTGTTYIWKSRVETLPSGETWYGFKVWDAAQAEPLGWLLEGTEVDQQPDGGVLLIAHHVDATYGNAEVLDLQDDVDAPAIFDVQVDVSDDMARISWTTDEPAPTQIDYGTTQAYGQQIQGTFPNTSHVVLIDNLTPSAEYHFQISAEDQRSNLGTTGDQTFTTLAPGASGSLIYDGFDSLVLDTALWTFIDPLGDATLNLTGSHADISVPPGDHSVWTDGNTLPRLAQPLADDDFDVEVKFDSAVTLQNQSQGILIEQDSTNVLRFEFHFFGGVEKIFAAVVSPTSAIIQLIQPLPGLAPPMYMRVRRVGDAWTQYWSQNGIDWIEAITFNDAIPVTAASVYAGNYTNAAHTASIDYFLASVATQASNVAQLNLGVAGNGFVTKLPDKAIYTIGENVQLTAVPTGGASFDGWTGDVVSATNPINVSLAPTNAITANFSGGADTTPPVISGITVSTTETTATVNWTTDEPATSLVEYDSVAGPPYGSQVSSASYVTSHSLPIAGLTAGMTYHYMITSEDAATNSASSVDLSFTTDPPGGGGQGPVSDDFHTGSLDTGLWTFVNPLGDGSVSMSDTQLQIAVPANGVFHDPWTFANEAPRVSQDIDDVNFEIEVKIDSDLPVDGKIQGILVEQNPNEFVRVEFHTNGGEMRAFAGTVFGGIGIPIAFPSMPRVSPMWLRLNRSGDLFTASTSFDGTVFTPFAVFNQPMTAAQVSLFVGNNDVTPHTAVFDYVFDTTAPIVPEDGYALTTLSLGNGSITRDPDQPNYEPGEMVTLTANPDPGYSFDTWSGDASGSQNPLVVTMNAATSINAAFADAVPPVISDVTVTPVGADGVEITWTTDEPATSVVDWGLALPYSDHAEDLTLVTSHSMSLAGLSRGVTYHYEVSSADAESNSAASGDLTFLLQNACGLLGIELLCVAPLAGALRAHRRRARATGSDSAS